MTFEARHDTQEKLEKFASWCRFLGGKTFTAQDAAEHLEVDVKRAQYIIRKFKDEIFTSREGSTSKYRRMIKSNGGVLAAAWRSKPNEELGFEHRNGEIIMLEPIARNSDPQTSHDAAEKHNALGKRAERLRQVLWLICESPGSTTGELSRYMFSKHPDLPMRTCAESPHKRAGELERRDLVFRGDKRKCLDSGYQGETWYITDRGRKELGIPPADNERGQTALFN